MKKATIGAGLGGLTAAVGFGIFALYGSATANADTVLMVGGADVEAFPGAQNGVYMPAILGGALLIKNRDPYGASIGLWFIGVSLLDIAPYMYDALQPQLMLLSGRTGEEGGHDWIFLFSSMGLLHKAPFIGALFHKLGALTVIAALCWGARVLQLEYGRGRENGDANGD